MRIFLSILILIITSTLLTHCSSNKVLNLDPFARFTAPASLDAGTLCGATVRKSILDKCTQEIIFHAHILSDSKNYPKKVDARCYVSQQPHGVGNSQSWTETWYIALNKKIYKATIYLETNRNGTNYNIVF